MFELDPQGRLNNMRLPARHALQPLFEAITNSIHSIEDGGGTGQIDVYMDRDRNQELISDQELSSLHIDGFQVHGTGIGFTEGNWKAFSRSGTTAKASRGGPAIAKACSAPARLTQFEAV